MSSTNTEGNSLSLARWRKWHIIQNPLTGSDWEPTCRAGDARRSNLRMRMTDLLDIEARLLRAACTILASLTRSGELQEIAIQILVGVELPSRPLPCRVL